MQTVSQMTLQELVGLQVNQKLIMQGISWDFYERLLKDFKDSNALRFAFDNGTLEIEMPLGQHEVPKTILTDLISTICIEKDIIVKNFGSTTFRNRSKSKGVEPDSSFYIKNEEKVRGLLNLDLSRDPPPDLAIEIDITNPSIEKLPIYANLKVREVWLYRGEEVVFYELTGETYRIVKQSVALPFLSSEKATEFLHKGLNQVYNKWVKEVRNWANEQ